MRKEVELLAVVLLLFTGLTASSCVEIEQPDDCKELYREYSELKFKASNGSPADRAIFDFWFKLHRDELVQCE